MTRDPAQAVREIRKRERERDSEIALFASAPLGSAVESNVVFILLSDVSDKFVLLNIKSESSAQT